MVFGERIRHGPYHISFLEDVKCAKVIVKCGNWVPNLRYYRLVLVSHRNVIKSNLQIMKWIEPIEIDGLLASI